MRQTTSRSGQRGPGGSLHLLAARWLWATFLVIAPLSASAASFQWTPGSGVVTRWNSLEQTAGGVTAVAQGYVVEYTNGASSTVFGPFPTREGISGLPMFGVDVRRLGVQANESIGLLAQSLPGRTLAGADVCISNFCTLRPGLDNFDTYSTSVSKLDMVGFAFSDEVTVGNVTVDDVSNFDRDFWAAGCPDQPNFGQGLAAALQGCVVRHRSDDISDGPITRNVGLEDIRYLLIGARPRVRLGPLFGGGTAQFYVMSFVTQGDSGGGGIPPGNASIGDYVWDDSNGNGIQDAGETGVPGVTVALRSCNSGTDLGTTTTDGNGNYAFADIAEARYEMWVALPSGFTGFSPFRQGSRRVVDSDAQASGRIGCFDATDGQFKRGFDAGMVR